MHRFGKNASQKVVPLRVYPWPRSVKNPPTPVVENEVCSDTRPNKRERGEASPPPKTHAPKTYFLPPFL